MIQGKLWGMVIEYNEFLADDTQKTLGILELSRFKVIKLPIKVLSLNKTLEIIICDFDLPKHSSLNLLKEYF